VQLAVELAVELAVTVTKKPASVQGRRKEGRVGGSASVLRVGTHQCLSG
jgi:hypothetical protein